MGRFFVHNGRFDGVCSTCGCTLQINQGIARQPARKGDDWKYIKTCLQQSCLAAAEAQFSGFIAFARTELAGIREIVEHENTWKAIMKPFDNDCQAILRGLGAKWDRGLSSYVLPRMSSTDRSNAIELLGNAGFDLCDSFAQLGDDEMLAAIREKISTLKDRGLYDYQVEGVEWLLNNEFGILGDDMGLGKTLQLLMAMLILMELSMCQGCLVVCPASLVYNWYSEIKYWLPELDVKIVKGKGKRKRKDEEIVDLVVPEKGQIVIVNYAKLPKEKQLAEMDWSNTVVACDECHLTKNPKAARSKRVKHLVNASKSAWGATGTPMMNRPPDLWHTLNNFNVAKRVFGSYGGFFEKMGGWIDDWGHSHFSLGSVADDVPALLQRGMLRRTKEMALAGLPSKLRNPQLLDMDAKTKKMADLVWKEYQKRSKAKSSLEAREEAIEASKARKLEDNNEGLGDVELGEIAQMRAELAYKKLSVALEIIEQFETDGKPLVVMSAHRKPILEIGEREGWEIITGSTPNHKRQQIVEAFQNGELKGLAGTIQAMGTGLTLLTNLDVVDCDTMLFLDQSWLPAENAQAEDRICRIHKQGKKRDRCNYITLLWDHNVDRYVYNLVAKKQKTVDLSVGAASDVKLDDPVLQGLREASKEITNPVALDISEEEIADLVEALKEAKEAKDKAKAEAKAKAIALGKWDSYKDRWLAKGIEFAKGLLSESDTDTDSQTQGSSRPNYGIEIPTVPAPVKWAILGAISQLDAACDGANSKDGMGFNKADTGFFKTINTAALWEQEPMVWYITWQRLYKYKGQIGGNFPSLFKGLVQRK